MPRRWITVLATVGALLATGPLAAQQGATGRIVGRVLAAETGRALSGARVQVQGTSLGATAGVDGRFVIAGIPSGAQTLTASYLGFANKTVTGVQVPADGVANLDITLAQEALALEGLVVTAEQERGTTTRVLDEQRNALGVTSVVSREEIRRSPDDNAAEAVQRVSGVVVEDGRFVYVRGLGERYTTTQLNGARLPSPEPDRRVVPLDLFPSGVLEGITVSKTFTPDLEGSFSGAQVNLRTRTFDTAPFTSYSVSLGLNDASTFKDIVAPPTTGTEWLGIVGDERDLPDGLRGGQIGSRTPTEMSDILRAFRPEWTAQEETGLPNLSLSASRANAAVLFGREFGYLGALSYSNRWSARTRDERALVRLGGAGSDAVLPLNPYTATVGGRNVLWGGVLNLGTRIGENTRVELNNTYDRTADNEALLLRGSDEELGLDLDVTRLSYTVRSILSNQLHGEHVWGERHSADWSATFSRVTRDEPDRSDLVYAREIDPQTGLPGAPAFLGLGSQTATRTFSELSEYSTGLEGNYALRFGGGALPAQLKIGGLYRYTDRDAESRSYDFVNRGLSAEERALPPEQLFDGRFFDSANPAIGLTVNPFGGTYTAAENLGAGYAMVEYPLSGAVNVVGGARVEAARIEVDAVDIIGRDVSGELNNVDVLPSLALNWQLSDRQNLRFSASQTLSRPEYRELAAITYLDYFGGLLVFGNPDLERALIRNYDARWEWYPVAGDAISLALFAKDFDQPIERTLQATTGAPSVSFQNAEGATNYGVELEVRRNLGILSSALEPLSLSANATLVESEIEVAADRGGSSATNRSRPLLGQAPYVVNLGVTYAAPNDATATVLFNASGERITEVGLGGFPDAYEQPRETLDFAAEYPLFSNGALRLEAENLLDSPYEIRQGEVVRSTYRTGRSFSVGASFRY